MRRSVRIFIVLLGTMMSFSVLPPALAADADIPMRVTVDGLDGYVPPGTTVGELLDILHHHPRKGNLVSVTGTTLRPGVVAGKVLLAGATTAMTAVLREGDAVKIVNGANVREPVERALAPAGAIGNPIRSIPVYYGEQVYVVRGTISHEVISETSGGSAHPAVALTFDDGPTPQWTMKILAVLRKFNVKATFFHVGRQIAYYPQIENAIRAAGMPIQNHSWSHENMARLSPAQQSASMLNMIRALRSIGSPLPRWFRPPYGSYTRTTVRIASSLGMRTVIWTADPLDWRRPGAGVIASRILAQTRPGGVILMHDGGGDRSQTLAALPTILTTLLRRGYRFVTLS